MTQDRRITDKLPGQPLQWDDNAAPAESPSAAPAAGQAGLAKASVLDLPTEIMNLPCNPVSAWPGSEQAYYRLGHRDARHAAADLVLERADELASLAAPVAADTEQATDEQLDKSGYMPPFAAPAGQHSAWVVAEGRLPEIPAGDSREFIIACQRGHNGKTYVFAAEYLNAKLLLTDDDDCPEDGMPFTGWYQERDDSSGEYTAWNPVCQAGDVVTHWMPLPPAPGQSDACRFRAQGGNTIDNAAPLATPADAGAGEALTKERITGIGLSLRMQAFENAAYRADIGSKMTAPEQDEFNQQVKFARAIEREVVERVGNAIRLAHMSTPGAPVAPSSEAAVTAPKIDTPEFRDMLFRFAREAMPTEEIIAHVQKRFDAYAKGVVAATEYLHAELEKARAAVGQSPAPVTAEPAQSVEEALDMPEFWKLVRKYSMAPDGEPRHTAAKALLGHIATPATARQAESLQTRDAIRDQALEEAAAICDKSCVQPAIAKRVRALKSMERAADAIQDRTLEYRTCCDYPGCLTCNGFGGFYRKRAADAAETRDAKGGE